MTTSTQPTRKRVARTAEVARTEVLAPAMVRVIFTGEDLRAMPALEFTDHYVKILFPPAGADYAWPFDPDELRASRPADEWPVTRTYTIRSYDPLSGEMAVDFVIHGDEGVAGPWAANAQPGDRIGFFGPGGGYAPEPTAAHHVYVGDEAAIPAIATALERLPAGARASALLEVQGPGDHQPMPVTDRTTLTWVDRGSRPYGEALVEAVRAAGLPDGKLDVFVHGNAEMVRQLRRWLFVDLRVDRSAVSISGYWRTGQTEDRWQATKREFNQEMEADEARAAVS
jgi:NADPH-dependent ferric siderophore reductase